MKVSVIITAYRNASILKRTLHGYLCQSRAPDEIIVAEDAEDLNLKHLLPIRSNPRQKFIHVAHKDRDYRRAEILTKAIAASMGEYLVLSDADCIPHKKFVQDHAAFAKPGQYILGTRAYVAENVVPYFKNTFPRRVYHCLRKEVYPKKVSFRLPWVNWASNTSPLGANMSFWKDDLVLVNGFDNDFVGWGHEDMELINRMDNAGMKQRFLHQQCILYHLNHSFLPRDDSDINTQRWNATKTKGLTCCANGLEKYLSLPREQLAKSIFSV